MSTYKKYMLPIQKKKLAIVMGICVIAGSLSACGDDTSVTIEPVSFQELEEPLGGKTEGLEENEKSDVTDVSLSAEDKQSMESTEEASTEQQPDKISITISAAGDVTLGNYLTQDYAWSFRQTYEQEQNDAYFFENVYPIFSVDDMTIVNLEGPLTDSEDAREGQYVIKGDPEYVNILTEGSVEAVSFGNNHRLDYKEQGTRDTVQA